MDFIASFYKNFDFREGWWNFNFGRVLWLCVFANFINSADRVIMPIAIGNIAAEFDYSLMEQGWILSAFPAGYISSQVSFHGASISVL